MHVVILKEIIEQNYGPRFDLVSTGLPGPIEIVGRRGDETMIKDLSKHKWSYQNGLKGFDEEFFKKEDKASSEWKSEELPINRKMTWYKVNYILNSHY